MTEETPASGGEDEFTSQAMENAMMEQDAIDALFSDAVMQQPGYRSVVERIIKESVAHYDRLPMLDIVLDRLVMMVTASLKRLTTANSDIRIGSINSMRYNEALGNIPLPGLLAVVNADPWAGQLILAIDAPLLYSSIEMMLGGRKSSAAKAEGRSFTSIERRLASKLMETILKDLEEAFAPLCAVKFSIERLEGNTQFATVAQGNSPTVHATFNVMLDERQGQFEFVIPYSTIDPIRNILQKVFLGEKLGGDPAWEAHLREEIQAASVVLRANLHSFEAELGEVLKWRAGDTLELHVPEEQRVTVTCGKIPLFSARLGQMNGHKAIKVEADLGGKEDMVDALVSR